MLLLPLKDNPPKPASVTVSVDISESVLVMLFEAVTTIGEASVELEGPGAGAVFDPKGEG